MFTSSTVSSVKSEDAASLFDSASSVRSIPNTASSRSSIISNMSARTSKLLGRRSQSGAVATQSSPAEVDESSGEAEDEAATQSSEPAMGAMGSLKQKVSFTCGFCSEEGIQKTCTRKNDLKRHIEDFHNTDAQWFCRQRGCNMVFDWQTAYKTHLKLSHGSSRMAVDEVKVNLCPQTVFACGFEHCVQVFEASSDDEVGSTFKDFVAHVVKHFDEGPSCGPWTYSARIRNLLRQSGVWGVWNSYAIPGRERSRLQWQPQSSGILRKRLETRHLGDVHLLIRYAVALGSDPASALALGANFAAPLRSECRMSMYGHKINTPPAPMLPSSPASLHDPFQFKISRGQPHPPDPGLATYMANQRRMFTPRPPVRSGRSARPPTRMLNSASQSHAATPLAAAHYTFNHVSPSPMYGSSQAVQQQQRLQQQHSPGYGMLPPAGGGGIVADDIRSFQSMAGGGGQEPDMDMTDTQMGGDANFLGTTQNYAGPFDLQSPSDQYAAIPPSHGMESNQHHFGVYGGAPV